MKRTEIIKNVLGKFIPPFVKFLIDSIFAMYSGLIFCNRQSAFLWVLIVLLILQTCSYTGIGSKLRKYDTIDTDNLRSPLYLDVKLEVYCDDRLRTKLSTTDGVSIFPL